jgi:Zn-dependent protease with chaperone function
MTREDFDRLVRAVETGVGRDPAALRRRALWLAVVGYAGLLVWWIVVLTISLIFFAIIPWMDGAGKIVCGVAGCGMLLVGSWVALTALVVRLPPIEGFRIVRAEAPDLFAVLAELQAQLRSAPFHEVIITAECNASVIQVPRLGVLGWSRNYLLLGLPLMDGLAPGEMRAVLAHEFAHLSRADGRASHWIYRLRRSWEEVFQQFARPRVQGELNLRPLVIKFVNWFWPQFNAHAFVLSRANEYEADAQAARLAGPRTMASALVRLQFVSHLLEEQLWPAIWRLAHDRSTPPEDLLARLRDGLRAGASETDRIRWMGEAFRSTSTNSDTHPCLRERLAALGEAMSPPALDFAGAATPSAAEAFFGPRLEAIRDSVQRRWQQQISPLWQERHGRATALAHRLTAIERVAPAVGPDTDSLWDRAAVLLDLRDTAAAEPLLLALLAQQPDHVGANFHLGRLRLESGNGEGEAHLERAMAADEDRIPAACALLHEFYRASGRSDLLKALAARLDRHESVLAASRAERANVTAQDSFADHGLTAAELTALRRTLATEPRLFAADLVQKKLHHFPHRRLFVLAVRLRRPWYGGPNQEANRALARRLAQTVQLPGRLLVIPPSGSFGALARRLQRTPGAHVWPVTASM